MRRDAKERQRLDNDHEQELETLRREIEMRDISIKFHDQKMRAMRDENTKVRL